MRMPWEAPEEAVEDAAPPELLPDIPDPVVELRKKLEGMARDMAYAVANTAIFVHSNNPAFVMLANSPRGHLVPRGEVKFTDGTVVEFQDIGMCQPGDVPYMTVQQLMTGVLEKAKELGLELAS